MTTGIAETSLTVPGVNCVVDSGLSRAPRFDVSREATELVTVRESRSSAVQRAGRAHRTGPGTVYRCYSQTDFARMMRFAAPEMDSADLTEAALLAHAWSAPAVFAFRPISAAFRRAKIRRELRELAVLDSAGADSGERIAEITDGGKVLARVPADPRMAHALAGIVLERQCPRSRQDRRGRSGDERIAGADNEGAAACPKTRVARFAGIAQRFMDEYAQTLKHPARRWLGRTCPE